VYEIDVFYSMFSATPVCVLLAVILAVLNILILSGPLPGYTPLGDMG
jgi:hypothetical protein